MSPEDYPGAIARHHAILAEPITQSHATAPGLEGVTDLTGVIADSMARHCDPEVAFAPEGPYVVPVIEEA
jgi:hypothetical protein